jgi:tetratricopeptide (TPR) repeat protein
LSVPVCRAETVVANDGKSYSGAVTVTAHEAVCVSPGVKRTFALTTIKDIDLSGEEQAEFERRTQDLRALDAKALVGLGLWLKSKHQHDRAQEHFTKALSIDPNNAEARRELGFERKGLSPVSGGLGASAWEFSPVLHQRMMYDWVGRRALDFHFDLAKKLHALGETALEEKELRRVLQSNAIHSEAIAMLRPIVAKHPLKNRYRLPFVGRWAAVSGPNPTGHGDYSYMMNAFDFRRVDEQGRIASGDPRELKSYYTFEQPIYACADGEVYDIKGEFPDNPIGTIGLLEEGNRILIRHAGGERSVAGHLQKGSFKVKVGDKVKQGQLLALMGNSGRSATPHLHFAIYDGDGVSLPMVFADFDAVEGTGTRHVDSGALEAGRIYENQFAGPQPK